MEKIRNLSLRKTIVLYMSAAIVISFFLSAGIVRMAEQTQKQIWAGYMDGDKVSDYEEKTGYIAEITRPAQNDMLHRDHVITEICDAVETWTMLVIPMIGSVIAVFCFYRDKIKEPLQILTEGSRKIQENNLDFPVDYRKKDEMGSLCREFDRMRAQLRENNQKLWSAVEQERTLNAFVEQMRQLSGIEEREMHAEKIETAVLLRYMEQAAKALADREPCHTVIKAEGMPDHFWGDSSIICEVFDNLLGNAVRYARHIVVITMEVKDHMLFISMGDDGEGFHAEAEAITKPFYHDNLADDLKHFGLGMYLSKLYCEKHGGKLLLGSADLGGAYVKAGFCIEESRTDTAL